MKSRKKMYGAWLWWYLYAADQIANANAKKSGGSKSCVIYAAHRKYENLFNLLLMNICRGIVEDAQCTLTYL